MTQHDTLNCIHEPFGDAFYYGPERLSERYEHDEKERIESGFSESTYKTVLDRIEREASEVRCYPPRATVLAEQPSTFLVSLRPLLIPVPKHSLIDIENSLSVICSSNCDILCFSSPILPISAASVSLTDCNSQEQCTSQYASETDHGEARDVPFGMACHFYMFLLLSGSANLPVVMLAVSRFLTCTPLSLCVRRTYLLIRANGSSSRI